MQSKVIYGDPKCFKQNNTIRKGCNTGILHQNLLCMHSNHSSISTSTHAAIKTRTCYGSMAGRVSVTLILSIHTDPVYVCTTTTIDTIVHTHAGLSNAGSNTWIWDLMTGTNTLAVNSTYRKKYQACEIVLSQYRSSLLEANGYKHK